MTSDVGNAETGSANTNVPWYFKEEPKIKPVTRELLEKYSGIKPEDVVPHVLKIRDKGWAIHPYVCIGTYSFLDLGITTLPQYQEVLERVRTQNQTLLDLGCCFGQDLRKLAFDGAPPASLIGSDLKDEFTELGYQLFKDKESFKAKFVSGDIFAEGDDNALKSVEGTIDIVYAGLFFHIFGWDDQVEAAKRVVKLLRAQPGSMILGRQTGAETGRVVHGRNNTQRFAHDPKTWDQMWQDVGEKTASKWKTEVKLVDLKDAAPDLVPDQADMTWMLFACWRE